MRVDLKKTLFILPNLFTCSAIFCGFYSIVVSTASGTEEASAGAEAFTRASMLIVFAMFFDVIDGRVARLTKTQSAFGVQIDSLADVVSFGVAPAILVYRWSLHSLGTLGLFASFAFVACGAIRLARFNVLAAGPSGAPKKPSKYIVGLPIPGAAGLLVSLIVANFSMTGTPQASPQLVLAVMALLSFFMVSTVPFRSFKDVKPSWRSFLLVASIVGASAFVALRFHASFALVCLLVGYVLLAVVEGLFELSRKAARLSARKSSPPSAPPPSVGE